MTNDQQGVDFDRDLAKLNTIRDTLKDMRKHGLRGGLPQDEAFFLLGFIDSLWSAYTSEGRKLDEATKEVERLKEGLLKIATGGAPWPIGEAANILYGKDSLTALEVAK